MVQVSARVENENTATLDVVAIVSHHHGPACLFDTSRRPILTNDSWLKAGFPGGQNSTGTEGSSIPAQLVVDLQKSSMTGMAGVSTVRMPGQTQPGPRQSSKGISFEFSILPVTAENGAAFLVLGTNLSAADALQAALVESRNFHRAFAACSADFIWQVDSGGVVDYCGPRGLLDYHPDEVFGAPITRFFTDPKEAEASLVFLNREPMWEHEVWLSDKSGESHCFLVSSVPVTDAQTQWQGARGVAREITEQREREAELKKARYSERMVNSVLYAMRSEVDPRSILDAATIVAADTAELDICAVARSTDDGSLKWVATTLPGPAMQSGFTEFSVPLLARMKEATVTSIRGLTRYQTLAGNFLIAVTSIDRVANGAVAFGRDASGSGTTTDQEWSTEDEHIIRAMAEQLGTSLAQYELVEELRQDAKDKNGC